VPYTIGINLNLWTKKIDDALQITEQILPYFGPDQNVTVKEIPEFDIKHDVQFKLVGFDPNNEYEGHIGDDQFIIWTFNFEVRTLLFPGTGDEDIIKKVINNIETNENNKTDMIITQTVNPFDADIDEMYTIDKTIQEF